MKKYIYQISLILFLTCLSELLAYWIPLPIPSCIYGMSLMFAGLCLHIIRLDDVSESGDFMLEILPLLFTPATVGFISAWDVLSGVWIELLVITLLSTFIVMGITGHTAQYLIKHHRNRLST